MRTIALALAAAAVQAVTPEEEKAAAQTACNGYYWGLQQAGWTCAEETDNDGVWKCTNSKAGSENLPSSGVDSTSNDWQTACTTATTDVDVEPIVIVGTDDLCDAWYTAKQGTATEAYVATAADKAKLDYAVACAGVDGATGVTAFGVAIVAALAALAF